MPNPVPFDLGQLKEQVEAAVVRFAALQDRMMAIRKRCEELIAELEAEAEPLRQFVEASQPLLATQGIDVRVPPAREPRSRSPRGVEAVVTVMREGSPNRTWSIAAMAEELEKRGWINPHSKENLLAATRTNLSRAARSEHRVVSHGNGTYTYLLNSTDLGLEPDPYLEQSMMDDIGSQAQE